MDLSGNPGVGSLQIIMLGIDITNNILLGTYNFNYIYGIYSFTNDILLVVLILLYCIDIILAIQYN